MPDYIFKIYLADGGEHFLYREARGRRARFTRKSLPPPESLLRLLYLDIWAYDGQIKQFDKLLIELYRTREEKCAQQLLSLLDELVELHIHFQSLRFDWWTQFRETWGRSYENILDLLPHKEITHTPSDIHTIQNQVLGLIQKALDMDERKDSLGEKLKDYYTQGERDPLKVFRFQPRLTDFEQAEGHGFMEALCLRSVYDLIDFSMRECIKQKIKVWVCKNRDHQFALIERTDVEYCEATRDNKGHTCKEIGAIALRNRNENEGEAFKIYRREYKRRFVWIKAKQIDPAVSYEQGVETREKKDVCEQGELALEEFQARLKRL